MTWVPPEYEAFAPEALFPEFPLIAPPTCSKGPASPNWGRSCYDGRVRWPEFYWRWIKGAVWDSLGIRDLTAVVVVVSLAIFRHVDPGFQSISSDLVWQVPAGLLVLARVFYEPYRIYCEVERQRDLLAAELDAAPRIVATDFGVVAAQREDRGDGEEELALHSPRDGPLPPRMRQYAYVVFRNEPRTANGRDAARVRARLCFTATDDVNKTTEAYGAWVKSETPGVHGILDGHCETATLEASGFPRILHVAFKLPAINRCLTQNGRTVRHLKESTYFVEITLSGQGFKPHQFRFVLFNPESGIDIRPDASQEIGGKMAHDPFPFRTHDVLRDSARCRST